jgi:hypothetical protein
MQHALIPPREPQNQPVRPPMIFVEKRLKWEYKQVVRNIENEKPLDEAELNSLGEEGWEMSGVAQHGRSAYFYFKRQVKR